MLTYCLFMFIMNNLLTCKLIMSTTTIRHPTYVHQRITILGAHNWCATYGGLKTATPPIKHYQPVLLDIIH